MDRTCSVVDCSSPVLAKEWCARHYARNLRTGHPEGTTRRPAAERFWAKVQRGDQESCWPWLGAKNPDGYGQFVWRGRKSTLVHRIAYEELRGPIPEGLTLDHLCRNRGCANPWHCETVTHRENVLRG